MSKWAQLGSQNMSDLMKQNNAELSASVIGLVDACQAVAEGY